MNSHWSLVAISPPVPALQARDQPVSRQLAELAGVVSDEAEFSGYVDSLLRGQRDFVSNTQLVARRYDVCCEPAALRTARNSSPPSPSPSHTSPDPGISRVYGATRPYSTNAVCTRGNARLKCSSMAAATCAVSH